MSTVWCVYVFFDYFTDHSFLPGLALLFDYGFTLSFVLACTVVTIALRVSKFKYSNVTHLMQTFAGYWGLFISIVYFIYIIVSHNVRESFASVDWINSLSVVSFLSGIILIFDLYKNLLPSVAERHGEV